MTASLLADRVPVNEVLVEARRPWGLLHMAAVEFSRLDWPAQSMGLRDDAVRRWFGVSPVAYFQLLEHALAHPEAVAYDAMHVRRLARLREQRRATRTAHRLSPGVNAGSGQPPVASPIPHGADVAPDEAKGTGAPTSAPAPGDSRGVVQLLAVAHLTPAAHLVARPTGVVHLYTGPLTPSSNVPRRCSTVCKARTKRLGVLDPASLPREVVAGRRRACRGCSTRLASLPGRVEHHTRHDLARAFGDMSPARLVEWAMAATTIHDRDLVTVLAFIAAQHQTGTTSGRRLERDWPGPLGLLRELDPHARTAAEEHDRQQAIDSLEAMKARRREEWADKQAAVAAYGLDFALTHQTYRPQP